MKVYVALFGSEVDERREAQLLAHMCELLKTRQVSTGNVLVDGETIEVQAIRHPTDAAVLVRGPVEAGSDGLWEKIVQVLDPKVEADLIPSEWVGRTGGDEPV